ncbi:MAG: hypothetical protein HUU34_09440 [Saprospiraceae bacterium]|nr:hypothetical protein [Saprospiraceae bacterium]
MKRPLSISFNNTTSPPQIETQQQFMARSARMFMAMNVVTSQPDSNATLYAQTDKPDFVNKVEIGFTNNKVDQNFATGDYLELNFTQLQYNNGGQIQGVDATKITLADASGDWVIPTGQTGPKIKLQCANAFTWKKDENRSVALNIPVNPITDPVKKIGDFAVSDASHFGNNKPSNECVVTTASFGAKQKPLPVRAYFVDPEVKVPDIPDKHDDVVFITPAGLDDIPNKLSFEIDYSSLTGNGDPSKLGVPELTLSIQAGEDDWDLAPPNSAENIGLNISHDVDYGTNPQWSISHVDNENFIQFKCVPEVETSLLPLTGGKKIRLELSNIVTALSDGTVNMTLQISGIDGFSDWCWFLVIQKEEPKPQIVSFDIASPTNALLSVGQAVKLTWQTFAIKALELNYIPLVGSQVTEKLTGKLTEKDGYEVVPAATNSNIPDDFTKTQALPLNLVATKADGNTISRQVVVTMKAPAPVLEISNVNMQVENKCLNFSYMTRFTKQFALMQKGHVLLDMPVSNGAKQSTQMGRYSFDRIRDDGPLSDGYHWPADSQSQGGDCKIVLLATNQNGSTSKDLYFDKLYQDHLGGDDGGVFNPVIVQSVAIRHGNHIDAIIINGTQHGGGGGSLTDTLTLGDGEYISSLEVRANWFDLGGTFTTDWKQLVRYIKIETNLGRSIEGGTTGDDDGTGTDSGRIIMLGGRSGKFLDALDVYYLPKH